MEPESVHQQIERGIPAQVLIYSQPIAPPVTAAGLLLSDLFAAIRARLILVIGGAVGGAVLAILFSLHVKPLYEATAIYAPSGVTGRSALQSLAGASPGLASLGQMVGISMQGPSLGGLEAMILSRDIAITALTKENLLPLLFPSRWDKKKQAWRPARLTWLSKILGSTPQNPTGEPSAAEIARRLQAIRIVESKPLTGTISVKVRLGDPAAAARLANQLAYYVNEAERNRARTEAEKAITFLRDQLDRSSQVALQESLGRLLQSSMETASLADSREDFVVRVIDPAIVPDIKSSPKRGMYALFGFILGSLFATIYAVRLHQRQSAQMATKH